MMSEGFTKLFNCIITSSVWSEDDKTRIMWVTFLASADAQGYVSGSIPGMAAVARMSIPDAERAIGKLCAPDKYSRSTDHEGKRLLPVEGGWAITNYAKYREKRDPEKRREQVREAVRKHRAKKTAQVCNPNVSQSKPGKAQVRGQSQKSDTTHIKSESEYCNTVEAPSKSDPDLAGRQGSDPDNPDSPDRRCYSILVDVLGLEQSPEQSTDLTATANFVQWLRDQIQTGKASRNAYNEAIAIAKDCVNGDVPMRVFNSRIRKELGYSSPSSKRKAGRMAGANNSRKRP